MLKSGSVQFVSAPMLALLLLVVGGCANKFKSGPRLPIDTAPEFSDSGEASAPDRWWKTFNDSSLDGYINEALGGNYTLTAAMHRVRAARAVARREASDLFPDLDGVIGSGASVGPGPNSSSVTLSLDAAYQVDLWGQIESRVEAEQFRADATCADYQALALTLSADIARTWFALIEANAQAKLLEEQIITNRTGLILQESRFALGLIRSADVLRQRQLLESTLEQAVVVKSQIAVLEHQMAVLLGQMPQSARFDPGSVLPNLPPLPEAGLPMDLIQRRPDVRSVFLALQAADRDVASAITAQFPRLNLSGSIATAAENSESFLHDWFASIAGQLIAPLLDGGERRAEVDRTSAIACQIFNEYGQTILIAFQEVEDALAQERFQLERIEHIREQVKLAGQSSEQLRAQYLIGDVEYLDVLSAIQAQQRLQRELLSAQLDLILIRISLYVALAGGFDTCPEPLNDLQPLVAPGSLEDSQLDDSQGLQHTENLPSVDSAAPESKNLDPRQSDTPKINEPQIPGSMEEGQPETENNESSDPATIPLDLAHARRSG